MANDTQEVAYEMPSGAEVYVPSADSISACLCDDPECPAVHVFLLDHVGQPIAECALTLEMIDRLKRMLLRPAR